MFYANDLCITSSSPEELIILYNEAVPRLQEGNFQLRSSNSNCQVLYSILMEEDIIVQHGCEYEKILDYKYFPEYDNMRVANTSVKMKDFSKREILAGTTKIFYPLSFCSPVIVNTKIHLWKCWYLKLNWNEGIPDEKKTSGLTSQKTSHVYKMYIFQDTQWTVIVH